MNKSIYDNRYLGFAGMDSYPHGGMRDCLVIGNENYKVKSKLVSYRYDWYQIYDTFEGKIVWEKGHKTLIGYTGDSLFI